MSKEDQREEFASDPVAFEVKRSTTTTYQAEVTLTFRAGPGRGGGWGTANARRAIVREVFMRWSTIGRLEAYRLPYTTGRPEVVLLNYS